MFMHIIKYFLPQVLWNSQMKGVLNLLFTDNKTDLSISPLTLID